MSREEAARALLESVHKKAAAPPPDWVDEPIPSVAERRMMRSDQTKKRKFVQQMRRRGVDLKSWWYREMIDTPSPFTETMTLFWHNHFTSGLRKVKSPQLLYRQNMMLRRHAAGNYRAFLHDILRDPAMLLYLDNAKSRKGQPNENLARELFELFTLGEGQYTEQDVKEAARALTGLSLRREDGTFMERPFAHDRGEKTILGETGYFDGDDVVEIVLRREQSAKFITEKLWRRFIVTEPTPDDIRRLSTHFRANDFELSPLLAEILSHEAFSSSENIGTRIKSPVELMVGTVRLFDLDTSDDRVLVRLGFALGQDIFEPPNVKGWPGGEAWITADTLLRRQQMLRLAFRGIDGIKRIKPLVGNTRALAAKVLLPLEPSSETLKIEDDEDYLLALLLEPSYQLS